MAILKHWNPTLFIVSGLIGIILANTYGILYNHVSIKLALKTGSLTMFIIIILAIGIHVLGKNLKK